LATINLNSHLKPQYFNMQSIQSNGFSLILSNISFAALFFKSSSFWGSSLASYMDSIIFSSKVFVMLIFFWKLSFYSWILSQSMTEKCPKSSFFSLVFYFTSASKILSLWAIIFYVFANIFLFSSIIFFVCWSKIS